MSPIPKAVREMEHVLGKKVHDAYLFAEKIHRGEKRKSGEPYITHPVAVAKMLFDVGADIDVICAALLHDTLEDSDGQREEIANAIYAKFGDQVLYLVQAVSKDNAITDKVVQQEAYIEQIQRAFDSDIFAFFIKIADLIHNMSTIESLPKQRKQRWIEELRIQYLPLFSEYFHRIPLAHRTIFNRMMERIEKILSSYENDSR